MTISPIWADVPVVKGSDEYGIGADYITAKVNTEQNDALQSRDLYLFNKFREYYTKAEIDNELSKYTTNLDWKESVDTYDDILAKYNSNLNWLPDVETYGDLFSLDKINEATVNVKDIRDIYYFVFRKPDDSEGVWEQIDPNNYDNHIVEELVSYPYIYLNGYWQELNINDFSELDQAKFLTKDPVHYYSEIDEKYPEPEEYWVVNVVNPNNDFLLKGQVDYYEDIASNYPEPENNWLVEVINPNNNCTYQYNEEQDKWLRIGSVYNPEDGWVVNTKDTNYTYRYDKITDTWIEISANAIPLATEEVDGLLSKEDYAYIRNIENEILPNLYETINQIESKMFPLGTIVPYSFNTNTPPAGFVFAEGLLLRRDEYPDMWEKLYKEPTDEDPGYDFTVSDIYRDEYPGRFTDGDGLTTFRTPNLKGLFIRGWDPDGKYERYERSFGTFQNDAISEHDFEVEVTGVGSIDESQVINHQLVLAGTTQNEFSERARIKLYTSSEAETRPKNVSLRYIVKVIPTEKLPTLVTDNTPPTIERPIDADTLQSYIPSVSSQPLAIPVADVNGKLDNSWFNLPEAIDEQYVKRTEVSVYPLSTEANMIPKSNNLNLLDDWISLVTLDDVDRWIGYLNNETDIELESYDDSRDQAKYFISNTKFKKFLVALKSYIDSFKQSYTTDDITPTNERGYISNAERIKYSDKYTKNETYQLLYNFLQSYIPLSDATTIPTANKIPIAKEDGKLDPGWMSDLFLNKIGTDDNTGFAEIHDSKDVHIRAGIVDNTLTGNVNIQGGGNYSLSNVSPAKAVIAGYDSVENKGGNIELYAGYGGENLSSIGGSIILQSGTGNSYDGTIDLNNLKITKTNTIYTNESSIRLQQNDGVNNTNSLTLSNSGISYTHDNLVNDTEDYTITLNSDGTISSNKPNIANSLTILNEKALVPFENLPKTDVVNSIGDFIQNQNINTSIGNIIVGNIGQNTTITIDDNTYSNEARELTFVLTMKGEYNITWPVNINWLSGNKPVINFGETAIIKLFRIENGEWTGWKIGDAVNTKDISREIYSDTNEAPLDDFTGSVHKYISETIYAPGQEPEEP